MSVTSKILKHQIWHLFILSILLFGVYFIVTRDSAMLAGSLWGIETCYWLLFAILSPIIHQIYVLLCWRLELHAGSISRALGEKGFKLYKIGFALLILSRPVTISLLAISNYNTLELNPIIAYVLSALLLIPAGYLFYSVKKYFGFDRAFGVDHFRPDEYRDMPFVKKGIFRYTSNGMYVYGFLILYVPGLLLLSKAALLAAVFNHIYIWVHHYFTELPDIRFIYKKED